MSQGTNIHRSDSATYRKICQKFHWSIARTVCHLRQRAIVKHPLKFHAIARSQGKSKVVSRKFSQLQQDVTSFQVEKLVKYRTFNPFARKPSYLDPCFSYIPQEVSFLQTRALCDLRPIQRALRVDKLKDFFLIDGSKFSFFDRPSSICRNNIPLSFTSTIVLIRMSEAFLCDRRKRSRYPSSAKILFSCVCLRSGLRRIEREARRFAFSVTTAYVIFY